LVEVKAKEMATGLVSAKDQEWQKKLDETQRETEEQKNLRKGDLETIENLRRGMVQGMPGPWGDVLHDEVATLYRDVFRSDGVEVIPKGQAGADILITARGHGVEAEPMLVEVKNTQGWTNAWVDKAQEDARTSGAAYTVIITKTTAPQLNGADFGLIGSVLVTGLRTWLPVLMLLRQQALNVARLRRAGEDSVDVGNRYMAWVTSPEFKNEIVRLLTAHRRVIRKTRLAEAYLEGYFKSVKHAQDQIFLSVAGIYGSLHEIGGAVQDIPALEFKHDDDDESLDEC
jgi:hypothetical protein